MTKAQNNHGLLFTCADPDAAGGFDRTVLAYLAFDNKTGGHLKGLLKSDPEMPMAHCLRGYFMMLMGARALVQRALQEARTGLERKADLEEREVMHLNALLAWANGSLDRATSIWDEIARAYPRDMLALKMAHFGYFYTGRSTMIRDGVARALDFWSPADPEYSFLGSMYAFGLEESGEYDKAERVVRDALDRNPNDPWGIHAMAHVFEATDRFGEGVCAITEMEGNWKPANNFRYHVAWHRALFHYENNDAEAALAAFDADVFNEEATEDLDVCNDASLLLRIELGGVDVGDRWQKIAAKAAKREEELMLPFVDVHFVLALASSEEPDHRARARSLADAMNKYGASSTDDNAATYRDVGGALAQAIVSYRENKYADTWSVMSAILDRIQAIGGSHAQRDLFREIAGDALWNAEPGGADAIAFYGTRSRMRKGDQRNWDRYLSALERGGHDGALRSARTRFQAAAGGSH
ncbi:tetratricopeptide repeat protein [Oricola indica]|uniref:tetratricopeptide repeat protein n=1 Tax=Oricola indica TaxID=2872591 RepID=UPI003CCC3E42